MTVTFKQFITEDAKNVRIGNVYMYAPSEELFEVGKKYLPDFEKIVETLRLPARYMKQKIAVSVYSSEPDSGYALIVMALPFPDGMDAGSVGFFAKMAEKAVKHRFGNISQVSFKNKTRAYWHSIEDFQEAMSNRKKSQLTDQDTMIVDVRVPYDGEEPSEST